MRVMKWILALAAVQLCALGVVATVVPGCTYTPIPDEPAPVPTGNAPPTITDLVAVPTVIGVGGSASITAALRDAENDPLTWTLTLVETSSARGDISIASGRGNIASSFRATSVGVAVIRAQVSDGTTAVVATVSVTVSEGGVSVP